MTGWKTKLGGVSMILTGLGLVIKGVVETEGDSITEGISLLGMGFAALGIGHKIEKAR
jgi:hypothetical protein